MITCGIDPGLTGGLAAIDDDGRVVLLTDLPVIRDKSLAWIDGGVLLSRLRNELGAFPPPVRFVIERVGAMPKQGVTGVFTFGMTFGSILGALLTTEFPIEFVSPVVWKKAVGLGGKAEGVTAAKHAALDKARLLFPTADLRLAKHEGRAEALLIAWWAQRHLAPAKAAA